MGTVYGFCGNNCRYPVYTQEQVLSILQQMIDAGSLQGINPDESPVVALMREKHSNSDVSMWIGTEAEYNELNPGAALVMGRLGADGTMYFCTNDSTLQAWHDATVQDAENVMTEMVEQASNIMTDMVNDATEVMKSAARTVTYTATVSNSWTEDATSGTYNQTIAIDGILETDNPIVDILPGSDNAANVIYSENICKVFRIETAANSVTVWATETIMTAFPVQIKVVR